MGRKARATKAPSQIQTITAVEAPPNTSSDPLMSGTSPSVGKKKLKTSSAIVRKSPRIRSTATNPETVPVIHEINISGSDKAEEPQLNEDRNMSPDETSNGNMTLFPKSPSLQTVIAEEGPLNTSSEPLMSGTSPSSRKRKLKTSSAIVRRSQRIRSTATTPETEPVIHEINISEIGKEEPQLHEDTNMSPDETSNETERSSQKDNPCASETYKNMYINAQKKIEDLISENIQLSKTLENALGKVDVYEKQIHNYSEVIGVIASLSKVNENLSALCASAEDGEGKVSKKNEIAG